MAELVMFAVGVFAVFWFLGVAAMGLFGAVIAAYEAVDEVRSPPPPRSRDLSWDDIKAVLNDPDWKRESGR